MPKVTWVLIANSSNAKLYKSEKPYHQLELIKKFEHPQSREKARDLITDGYGRYKFTTNSPPSAYSDPMNPKEVEAERFAHELALELNQGRTKNHYHHLVLVAPSHFRGLLNKYCDNHVLNLVVHSINKDYTKIKQHDLSKYIDGKQILRNAA
jgi:protein required for attachment to host cells